MMFRERGNGNQTQNALLPHLSHGLVSHALVYPTQSSHVQGQILNPTDTGRAYRSYCVAGHFGKN